MIMMLVMQTLLVTNDYYEQRHPFSKSDLGAWYWCVQQMGGVGFFNSGADAGASQPHRHMQIVPADVLWNVRKRSVPQPHAMRYVSGNRRHYRHHHRRHSSTAVICICVCDKRSN